MYKWIAPNDCDDRPTGRWTGNNGAVVPPTEFRAGHAFLTKGSDVPGGTLEGATEYTLAAAEQVFCYGGLLAVVAVRQKWNQKKSQPTFKGSINARQG